MPPNTPRKDHRFYPRRGRVPALRWPLGYESVLNSPKDRVSCNKKPWELHEYSTYLSMKEMYTNKQVYTWVYTYIYIYVNTYACIHTLRIESLWGLSCLERPAARPVRHHRAVTELSGYPTQRVQASVCCIHRAKRNDMVTSLRHRYVLYSYMDPLGQAYWTHQLIPCFAKARDDLAPGVGLRLVGSQAARGQEGLCQGCSTSGAFLRALLISTSVCVYIQIHRRTCRVQMYIHV